MLGAPWRDYRLVGAGVAIVCLGLAAVALFDRPAGGILFLAGLSLGLEGFGQFHPLFGLLFPVLAFVAAAIDASRGLLLAALTWFLGAAMVFALGRVLRRRRLGRPVRANPAVEALTAELAALKVRRDRGEITEDEFRARRDAAVAGFRDATQGPGGPAAAPERS